MKRFRYTLETVLKLREIKEEEELKRLSSVVSELNALIAEREFNENEIEKSYLEIESSAKVGKSLTDYLSIESYIHGLTKLNDELDFKINDKNKSVDLVRLDVQVARKDKKVLEILKENRFKEWKKKHSRAERREVEEYNENIAAHSIYMDSIFSEDPKKSKKVPKTFKILNREDGGDELMSDFKNIRDFYEKFYMGQGR
ncbi:flagellar export protein FliJ [Leptospira ognonensis]|uniref:Flagellar export protein FliJ n=1 Tax=Leptospira ognonensis TaxID=2484945 RepID=A0A4R9K778_9LEPT|nr:flagellar export protein FliJ [Leptospira ognonensis]TGL61230.1 flagellar export protein FliJ [Leptospira ognonensis]